MNSKTSQGTVKVVNPETNGTVLKHVSGIVNEVIEVKKVDGNNVNYSGSVFYSGCNIKLFPTSPKVGDKFNLSTDFANGITKIEGLNG